VCLPTSQKVEVSLLFYKGLLKINPRPPGVIEVKANEH